MSALEQVAVVLLLRAPGRKVAGSLQLQEARKVAQKDEDNSACLASGPCEDACARACVREACEGACVGCVQEKEKRAG